VLHPPADGGRPWPVAPLRRPRQRRQRHLERDGRRRLLRGRGVALRELPLRPLRRADEAQGAPRLPPRVPARDRHGLPAARAAAAEDVQGAPGRHGAPRAAHEGRRERSGRRRGAGPHRGGRGAGHEGGEEAEAEAEEEAEGEGEADAREDGRGRGGGGGRGREGPRGVRPKKRREGQPRRRQRRPGAGLAAPDGQSGAGARGPGRPGQEARGGQQCSAGAFPRLLPRW
ncbi:unnamed protein product, partial [Prorocentrum cordatum]